MQILLQPAARSTRVKENLEQSIYNPVNFAAHSQLLDSQTLDTLEKLFPSGHAQMWGIRPGKNPSSNPSVKSHQALRPGAKVFFIGEQQIYLSGTVELAWESRPLAMEVWNEEDGQTWQYMYALSEVYETNIQMSEVRDKLNWKEKRNVRQFTRLNPDQQRKVFSLLPFDNELGLIDSLPTAKPGEHKPYAGKLTHERTHYARGEQQELRRHVITGKTTTCALCGHDFPSIFIVAAHIKMRSRCTETEMRNLNIVMPACRLGCDELYERGYIAVTSQGHIAVSPLVAKSDVLTKYVHENLEHREIDWLTEGNKELFQWHYNNEFKGIPDEFAISVDRSTLNTRPATYSFEHGKSHSATRRKTNR